MSKRIQIVIPEEVADLIEGRAKEEDRSISNFARNLILRGLNDETN